MLRRLSFGEGEGWGRPHLIVWKDISKPKRNGGLGIQRIRDANKALLYKWLWRFGHENGSLWREVIASKYGLVNAWETRSPSSLHGVSCWKEIMQFLGKFKGAVRVEVGSGRGTHFWTNL